VAFRRSIISAAILCILGSLSVDSALASGSYDFDLPEQSLAESLRQIAQRAAMNILFDARGVETMRAPAIKGVMSAEEALQTVLAGTDLVFEAMGRNSVLVRRQEKVHPRSTTSPEGETIPLAPLAPLAPPAPAGPTPVPAGLEEITVHAQRRAENLQTVPITVDTVSGRDAAARGTTSIWTLVNTIPNLTFTTGGYATNTYIRGVGDNSVSPNNEPSVAVYVDGVYNASSNALTAFSFNNIEQIEVLKGPQGTLFGRNATAGVIQIITPDPKHDFSGKVDVGYGNYETYSGDAYVTGGLSDKLSADLSVLGYNQIDGFGRDLTTNTPTDTQRSIAARSKWLYELSEATKIRFAADYSDYDSGGLPDQFVPGSDGPYLSPFNVFGTPTYNDTLSYGASVRVDQDFGELLHGVSISSYRWVSGDKAIDSDFTSELLNEIHNHYQSRYWTQEFQLTNRNPGPITWLAGAFYYGNQVFGADPWLQTGTQIADGYRAQYGVQDTASRSVFGQATADLVADTKLTVGLRYTDETLKAFTRTQNQAERVITGPFSEAIRSDPLTWRIALDHRFGTDLLGYVSYNRGFKSGGFNLTAPGSAPFYPEHIDAYETGLKSEFLDHRVRLNFAAFYYHYTDLQVAVSAGGAQLFENAAKARNYGMDGSFDFAVTDQLTLATGLGLLSAKYVEYPNARGFTILGVPFTITNAKGTGLPFAPPVTGFVSSNYRVPTSIGEFKATANLSYTARSYVTPDDGLERPAYWMLNATLEWRPPSAKSFAVRIWGKNLTGADYDLFATEGPQGWYRSKGPPRQYGFSVEKDF
jgi:iron complex outermembrane receptor protein